MKRLSLAVLLSAAIHGYLINLPSKAKEITLSSGGQAAAPSLSIVSINTKLVSTPAQQSPNQAHIEEPAQHISESLNPALESKPAQQSLNQAHAEEPAKHISESLNPALESKPAIAPETARAQAPAVKPSKVAAKPKKTLKQQTHTPTKALPIEDVQDEPQPNKPLPASTAQTKSAQPQQVKEATPPATKPAAKPEQQPDSEQLASSQVNTPQQHQQGLSQLPQINSQPRFAQPPTAPVYPRLAKKRGLEGTVMVEVWLDQHGSQTKREISNSSGVKSLDKAALKAVQRWQFKALIVDGQAQASRAVIPIRFNLS